MTIGVPMFFVISGYCITATAIATRSRGKPMSEYFVRRFRRIFPPYWFSLALLIFLMLFVDVFLSPGTLSRSVLPLPKPWGVLPWPWIGNLTLIESWRYHGFGGPQEYLLPPSWTLCYEEQFYLVTGLTFMFASKRSFAAILGVSVLVFAVGHLSPRYGISLDGSFFDGHWLMFALGVAVFYGIHGFAKNKMWRAAALMLVVLLYAVRERDRDLTCASFFAILLLVVYRWDQQINSWAWTAPLKYCGIMCYSLYLVHYPIVRAISQSVYWRGWTGPWKTLVIVVPLALGVSLAAAWVFYLLIERRFLNAAFDKSARGHRLLPHQKLNEVPSVLTSGARPL